MTSTLTLLSSRAARRKGLVSHADMLRRAETRIGVDLQARLARMIRLCVGDGRQKDDDEEVEL